MEKRGPIIGSRSPGQQWYTEQLVAIAGPGLGQESRHQIRPGGCAHSHHMQEQYRVLKGQGGTIVPEHFNSSAFSSFAARRGISIKSLGKSAQLSYKRPQWGGDVGEAHRGSRGRRLPLRDLREPRQRRRRRPTETGLRRLGVRVCACVQGCFGLGI